MVASATARLLGEAYHRVNRPAEARAAINRAVALNRALVATDPDDPALLRKLALSLWYSAVVHREMRQDPAARRAIAAAVKLARTLRERSNGDVTSSQLVALIGEVNAQVLADMGRYAQSFALGDEVIAAHRRLVALAGAAPGARRSLATALHTRGGSYYNGGAYARACASWGEARAIFRALDAAGELSPADRANGVPQLDGYLRRNCGPPRPGEPGPVLD